MPIQVQLINEKQNIIVEFLCLLIQRDPKYEVMTPRIDSVLDRFRQRGPLLSSETDAGEERITEEPPVVWSLFCCLQWMSVLHVHLHFTSIWKLARNMLP